MRKVGIVLIVCLLAVAGITAAMAYTSASVENKYDLAIVSTDEAVLAMEPLDPHLGHGTIGIDCGQLWVKPGWGVGDQMHGFQPRSKYVYEDYFTVRNNADYAIEFEFELEGFLKELYDYNPLGEGRAFQIYIRNAHTGTDWEEWNEGDLRKISTPGQERHIKFVFDFMTGSACTRWATRGDYSGEFFVNAYPQ